MSIKHIFFDLDRTLWDFEKNSYLTLLEITDKFKLLDRGIDCPENFIRKYRVHNERLWGLYRHDELTKEELRSKRFLLTLQDYQIDDVKLANDIGLEYIAKSPLKNMLFPFTIEVLSYLYQKYSLHIITNGFDEVQHIKLDFSDLTQYFDVVITSEKVGVKKPDSKIFHYSLKAANAEAGQSVMIGDDLEVDVIGASKVGMKGIYFNPKRVKHSANVWNEIDCLSQLKELL